MIYYIGDNDVEKNLGFKECINELKEAFISEGNNESISLPRKRIDNNDLTFSTMPAFYGNRGLAGLKTYIYDKKGYRFVNIIFNNNNPEKIYIMDANVLGQIRTGSVTAMVTSLLIKKKNINFTLIGSGFQAITQMKAMSELYNIENAWVYSRNYDHASKFAGLFKSVKAVNNLSVLKESDVITSVTDTIKPIINFDMLPDHYHINLVGSNVLGSREADNDVINNSDLIIDENREQSYKESSEISEIIDKKNLCELSKFINNKNINYKRSIFKCLGIGLEDLAASYVVLKNMYLL